jgi:hypothetical protein
MEKGTGKRCSRWMRGEIVGSRLSRLMLIGVATSVLALRASSSRLRNRGVSVFFPLWFDCDSFASGIAAKQREADERGS